MSLAQDFEVHIRTHLENLKTMQQMPSGLSDQMTEVSNILTTYDSAIAKIATNDRLTAKGKAEEARVAHDAALSDVDAWRTRRTGGIEAQASAQRAALLPQADEALPTPTAMQVQNMVQRLSAFDPLEVEVLYADATDAERRVIEAAAAAIGRQPRRRGEQLVWEPLIPPERVAATVAARLERTNPEGAAALRDMQRIRNTYDALAGSASGLLRESVPVR